MSITDDPLHISNIRKLSKEKQEEFFNSLNPQQLAEYFYTWRYHAREKQYLPYEGDWREALILAGRSFGKLFCVKELVPTPDRGLVSLGDLKVGDKVFSEAGKPCSILAIHDDDDSDKNYYKINFSDNSSIDCCGEHQWVTWTHRDRKSLARSYKYKKNGIKFKRFPENWPQWKSKGNISSKFADIGPSIKTTEEIIKTFRYGKRGDLNHCIPVCSPVEHEVKNLPIDPYILGYWLGDGCRKSGVFFISQEDQNSFINYSKLLNFEIGKTKDLLKVSLLGLTKHLRENNCLGKYSIPINYYIGSIEQRIALLQGLMDSDGTCAKDNSTVEFCNKRKWISNLVYHLACSLGQKPKIYENQAKLYSKDCGARYRVRWRPVWDINPFKLKRKAEKVIPDGNQSLRNYHRMITSYEEIDKKPMRCLTVDSENSMFLIGKNFIPTHNTRMGSEWIRQCVEDYGVKKICLVAPTFTDVRQTMFEGPSGIETVSPPWNKPVYLPSKSEIHWPNGAKALMLSGDKSDSPRGKSAEIFWFDEPAMCPNLDELYSNIQLALREKTVTGMPPRLLMTTTPRPISLLKELVEKAEDSSNGILLINGATKENVDNIDERAAKAMYDMYEGTRLGQQELSGEIIWDHQNALWTSEAIDNCKRNIQKDQQNIIDLCKTDFFKRIVVGFDPSSGKKSKGKDEQGVVVCGIDQEDNYWVIADETCSKTPDGWAKHVENVYYKYSADKIIIERNGVGALAESVITQHWREAPIKEAWGQGSKPARAEPVSMLYEKGLVYHYSEFAELEKQMFDMTTDGYQGSGSPDRVDALVWAMWELMNGRKSVMSINVTGRMY